MWKILIVFYFFEDKCGFLIVQKPLLFLYFIQNGFMIHSSNCSEFYLNQLYLHCYKNLMIPYLLKTIHPVVQGTLRNGRIYTDTWQCIRQVWYTGQWKHNRLIPIVIGIKLKSWIRWIGIICNKLFDYGSNEFLLQMQSDILLFKTICSF